MSTALPTILLVDDDAPTRYSLRRHLAKIPFQGQILEAEDGRQALALIQVHCQTTLEPNCLLILLDLRMPVMDGLEFLEHHRCLPSTCQQGVSVVIVSAVLDEAEYEQARQLPIVAHAKPVTAEQVVALVRQHLPVALS